MSVTSASLSDEVGQLQGVLEQLQWVQGTYRGSNVSWETERGLGPADGDGEGVEKHASHGKHGVATTAAARTRTDHPHAGPYTSRVSSLTSA